VVELDGDYDGSFLVVVLPGWLHRSFWLAMLFLNIFVPFCLFIGGINAVVLDTWKVMCWLLVNFSYKL
jgi:hypothetical protein